MMITLSEQENYCLLATSVRVSAVIRIRVNRNLMAGYPPANGCQPLPYARPRHQPYPISS
jgi:hypothetical protein